MISIPSTNPLEAYGVNILTGESCAFGLRLLCDLNKAGAMLIADYFSIPADPLPYFNDNWNSTVNDEPAIASIMLPREIFSSLIRFALFREGYQYVMSSKESWNCEAFNDADVNKYPDLAWYIDGTSVIMKQQGVTVYRNPKNPRQPSEGSRNVHAFTGRAV